MLPLADAVFDLDSAELLPAAGPCISCPKRTDANTVLFDDFAQDDRCMDASCFKAKVDAHIALVKARTAGLVQITRAYYTNAKGEEEKVLTRNEYTIVEPERPQSTDAEEAVSAEPPCTRATSAIVVEGPGKRGEVVQVCADPECEVHGKPNYRAEQESATNQREREGSTSRNSGRRIARTTAACSTRFWMRSRNR